MTITITKIGFVIV